MTDAPAMNTIALDRTTGDMFLDSAGNIAMAQPPYAQAQDMASAIKTFIGETYYNASLGVLDFTQILGQSPPASMLRSRLIAAALTVPGVTSAQAFFALGPDRVLTGQVQGKAGVTSVVATTAPVGGQPFILDRSQLDGPNVLV